MQLGDKEVLPAASKDGKQKLKPSPSRTHEKATVGLALPGPFKAEGCVCLKRAACLVVDSALQLSGAGQEQGKAVAGFKVHKSPFNHRKHGLASPTVSCQLWR